MSRHLICAVLSLCLLSPLLAEDKPEGEKKSGEKQPGQKKAEKKPGEKKPAKEQFDPTAKFFNVPPGIDLTAEQQAQVEGLKKEYAPRVEALFEKQKSLMTPELQQRMKAAWQQAQSEGKQGKELQEAVQKALNLTEEEKAARAAVQQELGALQKELRTKLQGLLTEEQIAQIRKNAGDKSTKNPGNKPEKNSEKKPEKTPEN